MRTFRRIAWMALAAGFVAFMIVPFIIPITTSGVLTEREAAGDDATFVTIGDLDVHYEYVEHSGVEDSPPLLILLHGFGASTYSWREVLQDLSVLGDVVAYDRPAFGFTERPIDYESDSPYGVDAQLELIRGVASEFAAPGQDLILVGHSAGGTLAAEFAYRYPSEVASLVLVAPALAPGGGGPDWVSALARIPQIDQLGPLFVQGIAQSGGELLERSWHDVSLLTPEIQEAYRTPLTIVNWERAFWEFTSAPRGFQVTSDPEGLSVPTAIITGDDDRVVATAESEDLATRIPSSTLSVIPASGHLPQEETPAAFMDAVESAWENLR